LLSKEKMHDSIIEKTISVHQVNFDTPAIVKLPFHIFDYKGMFFFKLKALSEQAEYYGGWYEGTVEDEDLREVNLAVNICTFKRESFVLKNISKGISSVFL
ncbi:MAG: hypothetical protein IKL08_01030, partial [Clostridia bacterium]|nr:hypothetical protein [Clostridia bacterium]